ncbi:DUF4124 domain-containing protein [Dyella sp.]|jgi:hypothetical protein|uniref:DUF4124 domain-containing protein n=1 Tax=Dyella sp. TaxID=1869338 RepID=UPI002D76E805|nr:DUF4124 domain-containing protein [Dyella sp.]HET6431896.1 DUF4124 domain-containing protein [Dyella sp.]
MRIRHAPVFACLLGIGMLVLLRPAVATTVYKCTDTGGAVTYQDAPCPRQQKQQPIQLPDEPLTVPAAATSIAPPPQEAPPPSPPAPPSAPLPVMFGCQRATDGKSYLSDNGNPAPYQAPFGMLGAVPQPLGSAYGTGGTGGAGASAPELNRGKVTSGLVANNYVWVQDQCRELSPEETCAALQDAYDKNEQQLRQAFKSERAPFEKREQTLQAQLVGCPG